MLNTGRIRDLTLAAIAHNIQFEATRNNIDLQLRHIAGKHNVVADLLSGWTTVAHPQIKLTELLPTHQ